MYKAKKKALTDIDILKYAKKLNIPNFRGVFMRDTLPRKPWHKENIIINLDSSKSSGTHWVAIKKDGHDVFYFDSFGSLPPPKEIIKYLHPSKIRYNAKSYQNVDTEICGQLCLAFLL